MAITFIISPITEATHGLLIPLSSFGWSVEPISVQVDNDSPAVLSTIAIPDWSVVDLWVVLLAKRTWGTAGDPVDSASYFVKATYKNIAGTVSAVWWVWPYSLYNRTDQIDRNLDTIISGQNVQVVFTGSVDMDITIQGSVQIRTL
jgi:hypothetical protein